ncbi:3-hydroxyacyl-CoA dehydrogenase [Knoellia flava TL1]|uniref:3-hydroxyacyl-CoA dehydrogenase n=2 Tax=Knoellia flava TaxID=913969 RepID=A0A8H9FUC5_9MICO|nr:3-hydroxyacyl-CoA dehydrogenase NAD-binding domain-containing protein [Knoellia flava]KGN35641.1 3-hydroxyacyl-CoA dehydrogenase [Knoellia flava TL1]GGB76928.1 3-hydroxyacyl-CoA dehydrogenase [Knoellia flava]
MSDSMIRYERDDEGIVTLTMDDPDAGANTMNAAYKAAMAATIDRLEAERDEITGVVLTSGKKTFFAGGNLTDLQRVTPETVGETFEEVEAIKAQLRRLERLGRPVVAAVNGAALGGGLEIALACHHRIAVDDDRIKLGLPEVTLGLLPGGGGVTRLVRMLGISEALMDWLLQGQQRTPGDAHAKGVVDELVATREELVPAAKKWIREHADDEGAATQPWDVKGFRIPGGTPTTPAFAANLPAFPATLRKQLKGSPVRSPRAILSAAVEGAQVDVDTASRIESRYFAGLAAGRESTAMIQAFFFDLQAINSGALRPAGVEKRRVTRVGILGAGMMGAGIAHACATSGIEVVLKDVSLEGAEKGKAHAAQLLDAKVAKGRLSEEERDAVLARITPTADAADLAGVDVVVEAVFEDQDLKARVFAEVEAVVGPDTLLCSNTSTLPITGLQGFSSRPEDVIGLHFFSPVDRMKLVEIIRGEHTSDEATARAVDLVQQIRKIPVVVGDGRGFFTSRVFGTLIVEGANALAEGVDPMVVERAATTAGFPAPPLAMLDEVSLTLTQHIRTEAEKAAAAEGRTIERSAGEELIDAMVELGRKGRAAGSGMYDYPEGEPKVLWPGLRERWGRGTQVPMRDLQDRYLFRMALETAACFEEGVLGDTPSANIGGIFGIGFPPHTGGPATFMTNFEGGLAGFVARADELADTYGERFRPSAWLRERAESGTLVDAGA